MSDLIRRSDAIEAIEEVDWYHQNRNKDMVSGANSAEHQAWYKADDVYKALEAVPSADRPSAVDLSSVYSTAYKSGYEKGKADRPQGEWETEYHGNGWNDYWDYTCSNCGKKYERADAVLYKATFCPNCGARMKGADDE